MKYYLMRFIYSGNSGSVTGNWITGSTRKEALDAAIKAFFTLCSTAANSTNEVDTVILMDQTGVPIRMQKFQHDAQEEVTT